MRNKNVIRKLRDIIILGMVLIIVVNVYKKIVTSMAEEEMQIKVIISDEDNNLEKTTLSLQAQENTLGNYYLQLPSIVDEKYVKSYTIEDGEESKEINVQNDEKISYVLNEDETKNQEININAKYNYESESGLYKKELNYADNLIVTGFMPNNSILDVQNIDTEEYIINLANLDTQNIESAVDIHIYTDEEKKDEYDITENNQITQLKFVLSGEENESYKVYHVNDDGTFSEIKSTHVDNYVIADITETSKYILVGDTSVEDNSSNWYVEADTTNLISEKKATVKLIGENEITKNNLKVYVDGIENDNFAFSKNTDSYEIGLENLNENLNQIKIQITENKENSEDKKIGTYIAYNTLRTSNTLNFLGSSIDKTKIESITFEDNASEANYTKWDVSSQGDGSIWAWYTTEEDDSTKEVYQVHIGSEYSIYANSDSSYLFYQIASDENCDDEYGFYNLENFNTSNVINMSYMFAECGINSLKEINLSTNFETKNVEDMSYMFYKCGSNSMTSLLLGQEFISIPENNSEMFTECGKEDECIIYVSDEIYYDEFNIKNNSESEEKINYTRGVKEGDIKLINALTSEEIQSVSEPMFLTTSIDMPMLLTSSSSDTTAPTVSSISSSPDSGTTCKISVTWSDNSGSTSGFYYCSTSSTSPSSSAVWTSISSSTFTIGKKNPNTTYYIWIKDSSGNVSTTATTQIKTAQIYYQIFSSNSENKYYAGNGEDAIPKMGYTNLAEAFSAINRESSTISSVGNDVTVKLVKDCTDSSSPILTEASSKHNVTLDINGYTLTFNGTQGIELERNALSSDSGNITSNLSDGERQMRYGECTNVVLNIKGSSGTIKTSKQLAMFFNNGCILNIDFNGSIINNASTSNAILYNMGVTNISNGNFSEIDNHVIENRYKLNITGGTYTLTQDTSATVIINEEGSAVVKNAQISTSAYGITARTNAQSQIYYHYLDNNSAYEEAFSKAVSSVYVYNSTITSTATSGTNYLLNANSNGQIILNKCTITASANTKIKAADDNGYRKTEILMQDCNVSDYCLMHGNFVYEVETNVSAASYTVWTYNATSPTFPTWTDLNGQDDFDGTFPSGTSCTKHSTSAYKKTINTSDHHDELGTYITHVYDSGFMAELKIYMDDDYPTCSPSPSDSTEPYIEYDNVTKDGYDVYVYGVADASSGIARVQFPTWTENVTNYGATDGKDDIQPCWQIESGSTGTCQSDGTTWKYHVNVSDHNYEDGWYTTEIYGYDKDENEIKFGEVRVFIDRKGPQITVTTDNADTKTQTKDITITLEDLPSGTDASGLNSSSVLEYFVTNSTSPTAINNAASSTTSACNTYTNGTSFTIGQTPNKLTGDYYIYVRQVFDNKNNASTTANDVTIGGNVYHRFGPYKFDNTGPTAIINTQSSYITTNVVTRLDAINNNSGLHSTSVAIWHDISGNVNANDGTIVDGTWGTNYLTFNGTSTIVKLPEMNSNYQTIQATFSVPEVPTASNYLIGNWQAGGGGIYINASGKIVGQFYIGGAWKSIYSTDAIIADQIYDVAITYNGTTFILYINGVENRKNRNFRNNRSTN